MVIHAIHRLWMKLRVCWGHVDKIPGSGDSGKTGFYPLFHPLLYPQPAHRDMPMARIHLHLLSDSTGETLENIAKAAIGLFENVEAIRHFWPMVRSDVHLDRIMEEISANPGLVLFTLTNHPLRKRLETRCRALGLPHVAALDSVADALSNILGQETRTRPGRKHILDEAYFARIEAIQFTIAHDDGVGHENWEEADIVLAGVSRASKTPTSIYLANRGYKTANIPLVPESPPPHNLYSLKHPMVVGLTVSPERLIQIRRNRLLSLNQAPETAYVDNEKVQEELAFARRMFADNGWPVIDMTRRSIEEAAAAIINLFNDRELAEGVEA
ncbi:Putative pyruvate, phosphate dikinase regulatory protein [Sphingobium sp. AntQ-1]|nr:Putative pyruvate, phosphate dikinase regulatory protein [Sphingobium sp. AntQ-1]